MGRTIGFPTANLMIEENYKLIPKNGVYIVKSKLNNKTVFGIMNIGTNPTVNGNKQSIEVYYLDFDLNLYNQNIKISILKYIRSEEKFESLSLLQQQLEKDKATALAFIKTFSDQ